jgi:hypothetical protein
VCEGDTKTEEKCQISVTKRVHNNRCVNHPDAKLIDSDPCEAVFIYLRPESEQDKKRWLGFLSVEGLKAVHLNPRSCGKTYLSRININLSKDRITVVKLEYRRNTSSAQLLPDLIKLIKKSIFLNQYL